MKNYRFAITKERTLGRSTARCKHSKCDFQLATEGKRAMAVASLHARSFGHHVETTWHAETIYRPEGQ